jgi:hypothetical protein
VFVCSQVHAVKPAGPAAAKDQPLVELFARLKNTEQVFYRTTVIKSLVGQPKEADTMVMESYQSHASALQFSRSKDFLFFLNRNGQFRVNFKDREIYAKTFGADSATQSHLKEVIGGQTSLPVDSLLLAGAIISSKISNSKIVSYQLKYPAGSPLKAFSISYNPQTGQFEKITCSMERRISYPGATNSEPVTIRQTVTMSHYSSKMPDEAVQLAAKSTDLLPYLKEAYPGFRINQL